MKVTIGSRNNNLYSNQNIVGLTTDEVRGTIVMQLEFNDYVGNALTPSQIKMKQEVPEGNEYTATTEERSVTIGTRTGGQYAAREYLEANTLKYRSSSPDGYTIESVNEYQLIELTTSEQVYTKFKFI